MAYVRINTTMPRFFYKAKKGPGETINGSLDAENLDGAISQIIRLGLAPLDVSTHPPKEGRIPKKAKNPYPLFYRRIKSTDRTMFTRQLFDLVEGGVPLLRALNVVVAQTLNPVFKGIIERIRSFVRDGGSLADALAQYPQVFSRLYVNMIHSGEISGNLDVVLGRLVEFADKDEETRAKVRSSLIYPALMLIVGTATIFVLLTFVIPRLTVMFDDLSQALPLPTIILITLSQFLERFWWLVLFVALLIAWYFRKLTQSAEGKLWLDQWKLKIPFLGKFIQDVEIGRFARTLGTLLQSGVTIVTALDAVWALLDNEVIRKEIRKVSEEVAGGASLSLALRKCPHFPDASRSVIAVGEESGHLEHALQKLADAYERQSDRSVKTVTSLLEPLLIVAIGAVVGFIVIAMLLPIFKMNLIIR
ncbi:MAG: type II secretion system F family protein [Candidatus Omnitrophota bacterium]